MLELQTAGFRYPTTGAIEIITERPVRDLTASRPPAAASPRPAGLGERRLNVENRVNQEHVLERTSRWKWINRAELVSLTGVVEWDLLLEGGSPGKHIWSQNIFNRNVNGNVDALTLTRLAVV
ncbi:hypothetical protein KUCAC02_033176 [Chaenocephalus aceratus]|nr:hypothetical protein KUCAC02_033176 [Chaenocephalus aceratus]